MFVTSLGLTRLLSSCILMGSLLCLLCSSALAQKGAANTQQSTPIVTATMLNQRVRYSALGEVNETRLQVFAIDGAQVFDSSFKLGNLIDWSLVDQQGQALTEGSYLFLITVKEFNGNLSQRYGTVHIGTEQVTVTQSRMADLTQAEAGALDANKVSFSVTTVDQVGAVSPTRNGVAPNDGSIVIDAVPPKKSGASLTIGGVNISGTGTTNRVTKWTDGPNGVLGDSNITEVSGNVGIGTPSPGNKLDVVGTVNATQYKIGGAVILPTTGTITNTYTGNNAGAFTTGGNDSFYGNNAGVSNTSGSQNTFLGRNAGAANQTGNNNTFVGQGAGQANTADNNVFFGAAAGINNTGSQNTFIGQNAGPDSTTGTNNIFIGRSAGSSITSGSNNIMIGASPGGNLNGTLFIGGGSIASTVISGIFGTDLGGGGSAVFINSNGQLGSLNSSRRFKLDIHNMGNASSKLMMLRPVTFYYKSDYAKGDHLLQYGLIAEEVEKVYPELVQYGVDGKVMTVRYHLLSTMLLNEVQKQQHLILSQTEQLQTQAQQISDLEIRLRRLESQARQRQRRKLKRL